MSVYQSLSDQLYTWSAWHAGKTLSNAATPTHPPPAPIATGPGHPARLADRALQTLRQTGLQMRHHARPRSQILSVHQPYRRTSADGLCSPGLRGTGSSVSGQLSAHAGDSRGDLRHQPRAAAPPRAALRRGGERCDPPAHQLLRHLSRRDSDRQYAGELSRPGRFIPDACGGIQ